MVCLFSYDSKLSATKKARTVVALSRLVLEKTLYQMTTTGTCDYWAKNPLLLHPDENKIFFSNPEKWFA